MFRLARASRPMGLLVSLVILFATSLLLSINVVQSNAHTGSESLSVRVVNPLEIVAARLRGLQPEVPIHSQVIIVTLMPTPTRTPTPINLGNFVWDDLDHDGRQDVGEPGLSGITVQLWKGDKSQKLDQTVTNASGIYSLVAPKPGKYRLRVVLTNGDRLSPKNQAGGDDSKDSDFNPRGLLAGYTDEITIANNVISMTSIDAGVIVNRPPTPTRTPTPINIGNFVWNDLDGDGVQDANEPGLNGITVQLWSADKSVKYDEKKTNSAGIYNLIAPRSGTYRVRVLKPSGSTFSPKNQGDDDTKDSDINHSQLSNHYGYTDIYTIASNVISITSIDIGLKSVPATPTYTPVPLTQTESLALYSKKENKFAFFDTMEDKPPTNTVTKVNSNAPIKGQFVMGDWNNDGQKTPGLFKAGTFWYTNTIGPSATWNSVNLGQFNKPTAVAGRFSLAGNDCIGIIERKPTTPGDGFPLLYTCELLQPQPPSGMKSQWLAVSLPGKKKYQFAAGDFNGNGFDSIAVRRGPIIVWGNLAPYQGNAVFGLSQDFGTPSSGYGQLVAGDWDGSTVASFGIFYKKKGRLYYRNDLSASREPYILQRVRKPVGKAAFAVSWQRVIDLRTDASAPLPVPGTPVDDFHADITTSPQPTLTPNATIVPPDVPPTATTDSDPPDEPTGYATQIIYTATMTLTPYYLATEPPDDAGETTR